MIGIGAGGSGQAPEPFGWIFKIIRARTHRHRHDCRKTGDGQSGQRLHHHAQFDGRRSGPGDNGSVNVMTDASCRWTAVSDVTWIQVTSAASNAGNGKVTYKVEPNPSPDRRTGTITIGGQVYTVNQREGSETPSG